MIPPEKSEAVARGLREAFGLTEFEDIRTIKDLASSRVFRIIVRGSAYLLKISTRTSDPALHYASMRAAAEAGVAPRVWYSSVEDSVSIEDFVEAKPLPVSEALIRLPAVLRRLHAVPQFGRAPFNTSCTFLLNRAPVLDGYLQKFQAANILPPAESEEFFTRYAELAAVYPHDDLDMVSSHNDLFKPDNILFDGQRVWLVDWEAAFRNDRYADLAVVANQVVTNDDEGMVYLQEYFGAAPDPVPAGPIPSHAADCPLVLHPGFPLPGFVGQASRLERNCAGIQRLSSAPVGGRNRLGGSSREDRVRPGALGTALTQRAASALQRSAQNCFRSAF